MPQNFSSTESPARDAQRRGYTPAKPMQPTGAVAGIYGGSGKAVTLEVDARGLVLSITETDSTTYGAGAPVADGFENDLYFDTTLPTYAGYVFHASAWHPF